MQIVEEKVLVSHVKVIVVLNKHEMYQEQSLGIKEL